MKKGVTFFVFICLLVFGVSACGRENVSDPSEGKKASAENPKTTDRSSEESEQTSEQTEASVSAEEHSGQTDIQKPVKKDILIADRSRASSPDIDMSGKSQMLLGQVILNKNLPAVLSADSPGYRNMNLILKSH